MKNRKADIIVTLSVFAVVLIIGFVALVEVFTSLKESKESNNSYKESQTVVVNDATEIESEDTSENVVETNSTEVTTEKEDDEPFNSELNHLDLTKVYEFNSSVKQVKTLNVLDKPGMQIMRLGVLNDSGIKKCTNICVPNNVIEYDAIDNGVNTGTSISVVTENNTYVFVDVCDIPHNYFKEHLEEVKSALLEEVEYNKQKLVNTYMDDTKLVIVSEDSGFTYYRTMNYSNNCCVEYDVTADKSSDKSLEETSLCLDYLNIRL